MTYYAFQHHKQLLTMGVGRLDPDDWLFPDTRLAEQTAIKQDLWRRKGAEVFSAMPQSAAAQREVAQMIGSWLPARYPELYQTRPDGLYCVPMGTLHQWGDAADPLLPISWCVQEDLCILQAVEGDYRLTAASLCAPSYWRLLDKIGQPLDTIHAPVPGYAEQLGEKVNRFMDFIRVDRPVWRGNWSVVSSDRLYQPGDVRPAPISDPETVGQQCFLRSERQTLRRLPESGAVLFTIRVSIEALQDLCDSPQVLSDLRTALENLSEEERRYKSLHVLEPALSTWLAAKLDFTKGQF